MIYSGVDLIRTANQHVQKQERLKVSPSVQAVESTSVTSNTLGDETHGALLRLARFLGQEKRREKPSRKRSRYSSYKQQIERFAHPEPRGQILDRVV